MYIWVVLATFLAIMASYILPTRTDYRALTVEPLADAEIAKVVTQHKAALQYVKYRKKPYTSAPEYAIGELDPSWFEQYYPAGHRYTEGYISKIYCMPPDMTVALGNQEACRNRDNKKMLITYGPLPMRWVNTQSEMTIPDIDFLNAMRSSIDSGTQLGYTFPLAADAPASEFNISGSDVRLVDRDASENYIPLAVAEDGDFAEICNTRDNNENICVVYMSSI